MSRTGSMPLRVAHRLLKAYLDRDVRSEEVLVLDPFCGRGTTLLAGRLLGCRVLGADVAPEAVVCSRAMVADVSRRQVLSIVDDLPSSRDLNCDVPENVGVFYHPETLAGLLVVRDRIRSALTTPSLHDYDAWNFVLAALLGILHGHASYSLSVQCSHAFAMSPGYVSRYTHEKRLPKPIRDVKKCLRRKIEKCLERPLPAPVEARVNRVPAARIREEFSDKLNSVDLILTSPPYMAAQTYPKDNWLRLWLLGYNYKSLRNQYIQTESVERYRKEIRTAFQSAVDLLKPGGVLICVAGDVNVRYGDSEYISEGVLNTSQLIAEVLQQCNLEIAEVLTQRVRSHRRYYHALNDVDGHSDDDIIERVVVARKGN